MQHVLFWTLIIVLAFGFALAVQMRMMVALVLRRALKARDPAFEDRALANQAVMAAAAGQPGESEGATHLATTYPQPLRHLRLARRASLVLPAMLLAVLVLGRLVLGVI